MNEEEIIKNLKLFRMQINPKSPFKVFRDEDIQSLVKAKPKSIDALVKIKGFPKDGQRVSKYGEDIISFFINGCKPKNMDLF